MASSIEKNVMAAVRVMYVTRLLTSVTACKVYAVALSVCGVAALVSVPHVAANFLSAANGGLGAMAAFMLAAVAQTKLMVQAALLVGMYAVCSLVVDMLKNARGFAPVVMG